MYIICMYMLHISARFGVPVLRIPSRAEGTKPHSAHLKQCSNCSASSDREDSGHFTTSATSWLHNPRVSLAAELRSSS